MKRLREFWERHPEAGRPLRTWFKTAEGSDWASLRDVRKTYGNADGVIVDGGLVLTVFNVGGNKYRLVVRIIYEFHRIYVKRVMTHSEYSKEKW